jgi:hypothetical protein
MPANVARSAETDLDRKIDATFKPYNWPKTKTVFLDDFGRIVEICDNDRRGRNSEPTFCVHAWTRADQRAFRIAGIFDNRDEAEQILFDLDPPEASAQ